MTQEINNVRIATFTLRLNDCEFITLNFSFGFLHALSVHRCLHAASVTRKFHTPIKGLPAVSITRAFSLPVSSCDVLKLEWGG